MAIEYQVRVRPSGGSWTYYEGIATTQTNISSLSSSTTYEWQVRQVENSGGIIYPSIWATIVSFDTLVGSVIGNINTATETNTGTTLTPVGDVVPPVITLVGGTEVTHELGQPWVDPGYSAVDDVDGPVTVNVTGTIDVNSNSYQELEYSATDSSGNNSTVTRTVAVASLGTASTYDVQWREQGGSFTLVTGISATQHPLSGLTDSTTYEWQVRGVGDSSESPWSALQSFDTLSVTHVNGNITVATEGDNSVVITPSLDPDNTVSLNTSSESGSSNTLIPTVGSDLALTLNTSSEGDLANPIAANIVIEITGNIGTSSETGTANGITGSITEPNYLNPYKYDLEIEQIGGSVTSVTDIFESEYTATLVTEESYRFRVKAYPRNIFITGEWSAWSDTFNVFDDYPIVSLSLTQPILADTESLYITTQDPVTGTTEGFSMSGTTNQVGCTVTVTLNGVDYNADVYDDVWILSNPFRYALAATGEQEYDEKTYFKIVGELAQTGNNILVVR